MIPATASPFDGVYPATICPLNADYSIDEVALAEHHATVGSVPGVVGVLCNGHGGESSALSRAEKRRVVEIVHRAIGNRLIVVSGVNCENSLEAVEQARDAAAAGADALMVFPQSTWAARGQDATMALNHHRLIIDAVSLPIMIFQTSVRTPQLAYTPQVLASLVRLPRIVGVKEGSWEVSAYEANRRLIRKVAPEVAVMASGDEHLFTTFVLGSEGSIVSLAALIPDTIVALYEAVRRGNLAAARTAHDRIYPLARAIYGTPPAGHSIARLKTCLKLLGRLANDRMRPPLGPLPDDEVAMLRAALAEVGLL